MTTTSILYRQISLGTLVVSVIITALVSTEMQPQTALSAAPAGATATAMPTIPDSCIRGNFDPTTGTCTLKQQIDISIDYPDPLMDSSPFIEQTVQQYITDQEKRLFEDFVSQVGDDNGRLKIKSRTYQ